MLPKLMKAFPVNTVNVDKSKWERYNLADPDFSKPGRVDIIIGADLYELKDMDRYREGEEEEKNDIESELCENNFTRTRRKDSDGRYIVSIPFKEYDTLGVSKKQAIARFMNLEKKNYIGIKNLMLIIINSWMNIWIYI